MGVKNWVKGRVETVSVYLNACVHMCAYVCVCVCVCVCVFMSGSYPGSAELDLD